MCTQVCIHWYGFPCRDTEATMAKPADDTKSVGDAKSAGDMSGWGGARPKTAPQVAPDAETPLLPPPHNL